MHFPTSSPLFPRTNTSSPISPLNHAASSAAHKGDHLKRYLILPILGCAMAAAIFSKLYLQSEKIDPIHYHLRRLQALDRFRPGQAPQTLADYFTVDALRWFANGRTNNPGKQMRERTKHEQALLQLGYLERYPFQLNFPLLTPSGGISPSIWDIQKRLTQPSTDPDWWLFVSFAPPAYSNAPATIYVETAKTNIPAVAKLIEQWKKSKGK